MELRLTKLLTEFSDISLFLKLEGKDCVIKKISSLQNYSKEDLVFVRKKKYVETIIQKQPKAIITTPDIFQTLPKEINFSCLTTENVNLAQAKVKQKYFDQGRFFKEWPRIHPSAVIHDSVSIPESTSIGPLVVIGKDAKIGERVEIQAGTIIERNVVIGDDTFIYSRVFIAFETIIGKNVTIYPGSVIGGEGFGFAQDAKKQNYRIPQTGHVHIGDRVVIGSLTAIDRPNYDDTKISNGVIIDNLCHIAHGCQIGENSILLAQVVLAGSVKIGSRVIISGQGVVADHINVSSDTIFLHRPGIAQDIKKPGAYAGIPSLPLSRYLRTVKVIKDLPELAVRVRKLEKLIEKN